MSKSEHRRQRVVLGLMVAAVALGVAGQRSFASGTPFLFDGVLYYAVAIAAFVAALWIAEGKTVLRPAWTRGFRPRIPSGNWRSLVAMSIAVVSIVTVLAELRSARDGYLWPFLLWLAAMGSFVLAVFLWRPRQETPPAIEGEERWRDRSSWMVPLALVVLALALRLYRIADIPPTVGGDEANQGLDGVKVLSGDIHNPFSLGWLSVPTMVAYGIAASMKVFGQGLLALRVPAALTGAATVVVAFHLARRLQNRTVGWLTAALLATYGFHIHFSRIGAVPILDGLFMSLALLLFVRAVQEGRRLDWVASGLAVGLAQYAYAGARLVPLVLAASIAVVLLVGGREGLRRNGVGVLLLVGAGLIAAAPMIQLAVLDPDNYNARVNSVGIVQSGWLEREVVIRNQSTATVLFDQFQRAALGFNLYRDRTMWYGDALLGFVPGLFLLLGIGYATSRLFDSRLAPMTAWWWGGVLAGGMLTVDPPSSMRLVTLTVPTCFFVALALERCAAVVTRAARLPAKAAQWALIAFAVTIGATSVHRYFFVHVPKYIYGNPDGVTATELAKYARSQLGPDWRIVLFGAPRLVMEFATFPFLAPEVEGVDVVEPLRAPPPVGFAGSDKNLSFVFLPERISELDLVQASFPGGEIVNGPTRWPGQPPVYVLYNVRRDAVRAAGSS